MDYVSFPSLTSLRRGGTSVRICVVENKEHIRGFLGDMLESLGFACVGCSGVDSASVFADVKPGLILFGSLSGSHELQTRLHYLRATNFHGRVMLYGGRNSFELAECQDVGETIGLRMLPFLGTPFRESELASKLSPFHPAVKPERIAADPGEAIAKNWVEFRYQPNIDVRSYTVSGAETSPFIKHPVWGLLPADFSGFVESQQAMRTLAELAIIRAREDWSFVGAGPEGLPVTIGIPLQCLEDDGFVEALRRRFNDSPRSPPILVAISGKDSQDLKRILPVVQTLHAIGCRTQFDCAELDARKLTKRCGPLFFGVKADKAIANGCADDEMKQRACAKLLHNARALGAKRVCADGIRARADFRVLCDLGFDSVQGPLLSAPLEARQLKRLLGAEARASA